jgi:hypothetical protein
LRGTLDSLKSDAGRLFSRTKRVAARRTLSRGEVDLLQLRASNVYSGVLKLVKWFESDEGREFMEAFEVRQAEGDDG